MGVDDLLILFNTFNVQRFGRWKHLFKGLRLSGEGCYQTINNLLILLQLMHTQVCALALVAKKIFKISGRWGKSGLFLKGAPRLEFHILERSGSWSCTSWNFVSLSFYQTTNRHIWHIPALLIIIICLKKILLHVMRLTCYSHVYHRSDNNAIYNGKDVFIRPSSSKIAHGVKSLDWFSPNVVFSDFFF